MMKYLLEDILKVKIKKLEFLSSELRIENVKEKRKTVDTLVKLNDNIYVQLEVNSSKNRIIALRNLVYFYHIIAKKTLKNEEYNINDEYIHIDFTYGLSKKGPSEEEYRERNRMAKIQYVDNVKIIEFNMDKIYNFWYYKNEEKIKKYKYLIMQNLEQEELEKLSKKFEGDEFIMKYKEKCNKLNDDDYFASFLSYEEDQKFLRNLYISEGERIGKKQGIAIGEKHGIENTQKQIAKSMLQDGFTVAQVSKYTKLPESNILSL